MSDYQLGDTLYEDTLGGGCHWSMRVRKGTLLTLTDVKGGANLGLLMYNPENLLEKYNAPDTLKCQHTFRLTQGHCLYSDMGRVFASIVEDDCAWHDTVCGNLNKKQLQEKWTLKTYQDALNGWTQNGYDAFLVELAKYGLTRKDMAANLNLFSKVTTDSQGNLRYEPNSKPGDSVVLRFEMDTLVLMHTCPHPLNPAAEYPVRPVHYALAKAKEVQPDDECMNSRPENIRGFKNNAIYQFSGL
ncbi:urea amidolyase associated protein UAAP1 [Thalassolituus sp.]|uniref:urea amidolyase associated protein UAAP1 n=1 Tax=Thalassolituus sp. TaxID=2030822 RepID=UPI00351528EB